MPGQFRTSIQSMTEFLQVTRKSARKSLDKLKEAGVIHVSSLRRNGVLITVRDFNKFLSLQNVRGGWVKLIEEGLIFSLGIQKDVQKHLHSIAVIIERTVIELSHQTNPFVISHNLSIFRVNGNSL